MSDLMAVYSFGTLVCWATLVRGSNSQGEKDPLLVLFALALFWPFWLGYFVRDLIRGSDV